MKSIKDGGPAFPLVIYDGDTIGVSNGISVRDWLAGKAMEGVLTGCAMQKEVFSYSDVAGLAYDMADAMLKARELSFDLLEE
jgi:hypothetical protein